jgi:polyphosphate kinase 2 (PPK2 family)
MKAKHFLVPRRFRLASVKHHPELEYEEYEERLRSIQRVLQQVQQAYLGTPERAMIVLEGWDTAGKGGIVRRLGWALDPRSFRVHPTAAPTSHQRAQHYLQRFWERLPEHGQIVVFDRSWYGRVLVERVEQLATPREWKRAYREINEFEAAVMADGIRLVKIFLHITPEEQVRRFKDRLTNPLKRWKLSYEDFRNRAKWDEYVEAIEQMMAETSRPASPWYVVPANNKKYGRIAALKILVDQLGRGVSLEPRPVDPAIAKEASLLFDVSPYELE